MPFLHDHRRRVPPQLHSSRNGDRQKTPGYCGFSCLRSRIPEAVGGIAEYVKSQGGGQSRSRIPPRSEGRDIQRGKR